MTRHRVHGVELFSFVSCVYVCEVRVCGLCVWCWMCVFDDVCEGVCVDPLVYYPLRVIFQPARQLKKPTTINTHTLTHTHRLTHTHPHTHMRHATSKDTNNTHTYTSATVESNLCRPDWSVDLLFGTNRSMDLLFWIRSIHESICCTGSICGSTFWTGSIQGSILWTRSILGSIV